MANIPNITDPEQAFNYAYEVGKRVPELEPVIMKNPFYAYQYALDVIRGRWPEAEPMILTDLECTYWYAKEVIGGRWPEAESEISISSEDQRYYMSDILEHQNLNHD